ncbi:hypothetical protein KKI93_02735 [Xenorhabdus bovienii]|uniref:hypothetical protein n=1 Tax=Xenorhabdus bovienii TaxID=40576 RepID=UPI0023B2CECD|nr:hypothetical protein [Xenorhabdus bovienii]MDE9563011.1 hypothetical protein [Xenorhabdus bovienii]
MKISKINLYIVFLFSILFTFNKVRADNLISVDNVINEKNDKLKKIMILERDYALIFKNESKNDDLEIKVLSFNCMKNSGDKYIHLKPGEIKYDYIKDSDNVLQGCHRESKITKWKAITYKKGVVYKSCDFEIKNYVPPFPDEGYLIWRTIINAENCDLVTSALCGISNCLNNSVNTDSYDISISIKDDNNWEEAKRVSGSS